MADMSEDISKIIKNMMNDSLAPKDGDIEKKKPKIIDSNVDRSDILKKEDRNNMMMRNLGKLADRDDVDTSSPEGLKDFQIGIEKYFRDQLNDSYIGNTSEEDKAKREYLYTFIAALLLEENTLFKGTDVSITGRFKSETSFLDKVINRGFKGDFDRPINDYFGVKMVITDAPELHQFEYRNSGEDVHANEEGLRPLVKIRNENLKKFEKYKKYAEACLADEKIKNASRQEYYEQMTSLLDDMIDATPAYATDLKDLLEARKEKIETKKRNHGLVPEDRLREEDYNIQNADEFKFQHDINKKTDFHVLLDDYRKRIDNALLFQTLINHVNTIFTDSQLLKRFGVKIAKIDDGKGNKVDVKKNEKKNGYTDRTYLLDTQAGMIEFKLQTKYQEEEGESGRLASHMNYKNTTKPPDFPKIDEMDDKEKVQKYRDKLVKTLPEYFKAKRDKEESDMTVNINTLRTYFTFKKQFRIPHGHPDELEINSYEEALYKNREKLLDDAGQFYGAYTKSDIVEYIETGKVEELKEMNERAKQLRETVKNKKKLDSTDPRDDDFDRTGEIEEFVNEQGNTDIQNDPRITSSGTTGKTLPESQDDDDDGGPGSPR